MQLPEKEQYREALDMLAREIGLDARALAVHDELVVNGVPVVFSLVRRTGAHVVQMACKVGPLPPHPSLSLLRLLLQANTLGAATGGATLGLQNCADDIVLVSEHPLDTPQVALARACRTLAEMATVWSDALHRSMFESLGTPATP